MNHKGEFSLNELAFIHGTDKGSKQIERANLSPKDYASKYERHFGHLKDDEFTLIEIGVNSGASIRMWHEFFPKAQIVGLDIQLDSEKLGDLLDYDRVHFIVGDQGDLQFLKDVVDEVSESLPPVKVIIDDGSHKRIAQARSLSWLFVHLLSSGGYYAIEDLQADVHSSEDKEDPLLANFAKLTDWNQRERITDPSLNWIRFYPRMVMIKKAGG